MRVPSRSTGLAPRKGSLYKGYSAGARHVDGFVSVGVIESAAVVALGLPVADPVIGLVITLVILKITWDSWYTVRGDPH